MGQNLSKGAFPLSELAGQTYQFAKKMQQSEGLEHLHDNLSHFSGGEHEYVEGHFFL